MERTPLRRKTPLVKKRKPRRTLEQKTKPELIKEADKWFSRYIRLRDCTYVEGEWLGLCIDGCGRRLTVLNRDGKWQSSSNNGHYVSRGHHALRYDEFNCNLQSAFCNAWRDKLSMMDGYTNGLEAKYGTGIAARLRIEGNQTRSLTKPELLEIITDSKAYLTHALNNPDNYQ